MASSKNIGRELLGIVRSTIHAAFSNKNYRMPADVRTKLAAEYGVFVNIYRNGDLRGSFGYPPNTYSLADGIKRAARGAAFKDPRFRSLAKSDFEKVKFEVVLIKELKELKVKPAQYFKKINPKKHGLFIKYGPFKAMQLPHFAVKRKFNSQDFLEKTIEKAGLAPETWKSPSLKVFVFNPQLYSE